MAKRDKPQGREGMKKASDILPDLLPGFDALAPIPDELPEPKALTVQARHHFSRFKQLDDLYKIGQDGNPDMGFMTRLLTLCSLPRTDPGERLQYVRKNG